VRRTQARQVLRAEPRNPGLARRSPVGRPRTLLAAHRTPAGRQRNHHHHSPARGLPHNRTTFPSATAGRCGKLCTRVAGGVEGVQRS
jgi:hypothetical protein